MCLSGPYSPAMGTGFYSSLLLSPAFWDCMQTTVGPAIWTTWASFPLKNMFSPIRPSQQSLPGSSMWLFLTNSQLSHIRLSSQAPYLSRAWPVHGSLYSSRSLPSLCQPSVFPPHLPGAAQAPSSNTQGHKSA